MLGSVTAQITLEAGGLTGLHVVEDLGGGALIHLTGLAAVLFLWSRVFQPTFYHPTDMYPKAKRIERSKYPYIPQADPIVVNVFPS